MTSSQPKREPGTPAPGPRPLVTGRPRDKSWKGDLFKTLNSIKQYGTFVATRSHELDFDAGLRISNDPEVQFPLQPQDIENIKYAAKKPYDGRRSRVLQVCSPSGSGFVVRPKDFELSNRAWGSFLAKVVSDAATALGIPADGVKAVLQNLHLHVKGCPTKKPALRGEGDDWVATMNICLSSHDLVGGARKFSYQTRNYRLDTPESASPSSLDVATWLSDVTYEVEPVTRGYRLDLTYHIVRERPGPDISARALYAEVREVRKLLNGWSERRPDDWRIIYLLENNYSWDDMPNTALTGHDHAVLENLRKSSADAGVFIFVGDVTKTHTACDISGVVSLDDDEDQVADKKPQLRELYSLDKLCTNAGTQWEGSCQINRYEILGADAVQDHEYHKSAIILVPKKNVYWLLGCHGIDGQSVRAFLTEEAQRTKHVAGQKLTNYLMNQGIAYKKEWSPYIALAAQEAGNYKIFENAIEACFDHTQFCGRPGFGITEVLAAHISELYAERLEQEHARGEANWNLWLSTWIKSHPTLYRLAQSLDLFASKLSRDAAKMAFSQWRGKGEVMAFQSVRALQHLDHDFIMAITNRNWHRSRWSSHYLLPALKSPRCARLLLSAITSTLLKKAQQEDCRPARDTAQALLDHEETIQRMALKPKAWAQPTERVRTDHAEATRFLTLIHHCVLAGYWPQVEKLLKISVDKAKARSDGLPYFNDKTNPVETFLERFLAVLEETKWPPNETTKDFVVYLLQKFVLGDIKGPTAVHDLGHRTRGCGECERCEELDVFLADTEERTKKFSYIEAENKAHLIRQLHSKNDWGAIAGDFFKVSGGLTELTITKLGTEHSAEWRQYNAAYKSIEEKVTPLRGELAKTLLGPRLYGELLMLKTLPKPSMTKADPAAAAAAAAQKRVLDGRDQDGGVKRVRIN